MLYHQETIPEEDPLFRFAVFISSSLPWMCSEDLGVDVTALVIRGHDVPIPLPELKAAVALAKQSEFQPGLGTWQEDGSAYSPLANSLKELMGKPFVEEDLITRRMHPDHDTVRLNVPTAHILGKSDWAYKGGKKLKDLCDASIALAWEHPKGHEIPRTTIDLNQISNIIGKTVAMTGLSA
jgi:hypothetical protein